MAETAENLCWGFDCWGKGFFAKISGFQTTLMCVKQIKNAPEGAFF